MTIPTQTLAMVFAECSMLMARSVRRPLAMSARVPAPPSLCATTGQTTTSPRRRTPARTMASTARIAACSSFSTCSSLIPATIFFQSPASAMGVPVLLDHEHLIGRELVGDELRPARPHHDHVLDVVVLPGGLEREHHALLQHDLVAARDHRLLLVPPGADAVAGELARVRPAVPGELLDDELVDLSRGDAGPAAVDRHAVDLAGDAIVADLLRARRAEDGVARLVAGVAVDVGHVVGTDHVPRPPGVVALARVGNEVPAGVQDAVH